MMASISTGKKTPIELFAIGITIIAGVLAIYNFVEKQKTKKLFEENAMLENEIKRITLSKLKGSGLA